MIHVETGYEVGEEDVIHHLGLSNTIRLSLEMYEFNKKNNRVFVKPLGVSDFRDIQFGTDNTLEVLMNYILGLIEATSGGFILDDSERVVNFLKRRYIDEKDLKEVYKFKNFAKESLSEPGDDAILIYLDFSGQIHNESLRNKLSEAISNFSREFNHSIDSNCFKDFHFLDGSALIASDVASSYEPLDALRYFLTIITVYLNCLEEQEKGISRL